MLEVSDYLVLVFLGRLSFGEATLTSIALPFTSTPLSALMALIPASLSSISTYPNPVTSTFTIESQEVITSVAIFNVLGQQVINQTPDALNYVADFSSLTAGVYLANIATQSGSKTVKVIKK